MVLPETEAAFRARHHSMVQIVRKRALLTRIVNATMDRTETVHVSPVQIRALTARNARRIVTLKGVRFVAMV